MGQTNNSERIVGYTVECACGELRKRRFLDMTYFEEKDEGYMAVSIREPKTEAIKYFQSHLKIIEAEPDKMLDIYSTEFAGRSGVKHKLILTELRPRDIEKTE